MRPLEWSLIGLVLLLLSAAWGHWRPLVQPGPRRLAALLITVAVIGQLTLEGYRWQMAPAYVLTAALLLWFIAPALVRPSSSATRRQLVAGLGFLTWLVAAALPVLLPAALQQRVNELLPELPEPNVAAEVVPLTLVVWGQLHGLVWGELYEHFPPGLAGSGELYEVAVRAIAHHLGICEPV